MKSVLTLGLVMVLWIVLFGQKLNTSIIIEENNEKTLSPYFFLKDGDPGIDQLSLKETDVEVKINAVIAEVIVKQKYVMKANGPSMPAIYSRLRQKRPFMA